MPRSNALWQIARFSLVRRVVAEIVPEAERDRRQLQAGPAAAVVGHRVVAIVGRMPVHDRVLQARKTTGAARAPIAVPVYLPARLLGEQRLCLGDAERRRPFAGGGHGDELAGLARLQDAGHDLDRVQRRFHASSGAAALRRWRSPCRRGRRCGSWPSCLANAAGWARRADAPISAASSPASPPLV